MLLRVSLGIVFLWFGLLKVFGVSPVYGLVTTSYSFFPEPQTFFLLGIYEVIVGFLVMTGIFFRYAIVLYLLQLLTTFLAVFLAIPMFFKNGNLLLLTLEGEFVIKNFVLFFAALFLAIRAFKHNSTKEK